MARSRIKQQFRRTSTPSNILRFVVVASVAAACVAAAGCSQEKKTLAEIKDAYRGGDYRETVALCRHAIRRNVITGEVYYYYGAALLAMNRDFEGYRELHSAVETEPALRTEAGRLVYDAGIADLKGDARSRGARRLKEAIALDPALELGEYGFLVADGYFEAGEYAPAIQLYRTAIERYPSNSACEQAYFNLAASLADAGANRDARAALEELLALYPRTRLRTEARFKLASLTYDEAEKQFVLGNYDETIELLTSVMDISNNMGMEQKCHFLLGETYEAKEEFDAAYEQYRAVIDADRGAGGRIVERAREKIAAFQEAGLH